MNQYKPQSGLIKGLWVFCGIFFVAFLLLGLTSDTATTESLIKGMTILTAFLLIFPIVGTFFISIQINGKKLKVAKWFSWKTISIPKIQSIKFRKSLVGLLTD